VIDLSVKNDYVRICF